MQFRQTRNYVQLRANPPCKVCYVHAYILVTRTITTADWLAISNRQTGQVGMSAAAGALGTRRFQQFAMRCWAIHPLSVKLGQPNGILQLRRN